MIQTQTTITIHDAVELITRTLNARDPYTFEHSWRVAAFSEQIAKTMGLSPEQVDTIHIAAHLHDIGKIGVPDHILNKPSKLQAPEYEIIKEHSAIGYQIVAAYPIFQTIAPIILHHHERWDGQGYPDGLAGQAIPLGSRIIAVADSFDAISSHRSYRPAASIDYAAACILESSGTQFCPDAAGAFSHLLPHLQNLRREVDREIKAFEA